VNRRHVIPAVAVAALVAGELAVVLTSISQHAELRVVGHPEARVFVLLIGWSFVGSGLVAWHRRRTNRFGALMVGVGFAWFAAALTASNHPVLFTLGLVIAPLWIGIFSACVAVVSRRPLRVAGGSADCCGLLLRRHGAASRAAGRISAMVELPRVVTSNRTPWVAGRFNEPREEAGRSPASRPNQGSAQCPLKVKTRPGDRVAATTGVMAALVQFLGLIRLPFVVPYLARVDADASFGSARRETIDIVFQSFNRLPRSRGRRTLGYLFTGA
jgi:hypothetical protein